jgi:hypothetical protein
MVEIAHMAMQASKTDTWKGEPAEYKIIYELCCILESEISRGIQWGR